MRLLLLRNVSPLTLVMAALLAVRLFAVAHAGTAGSPQRPMAVPTEAPRPDRQGLLSRWTRNWLENAPKTREVADSLEAELVRQPMRRSADSRVIPRTTDRPESSATPEDLAPSQLEFRGRRQVDTPASPSARPTGRR